MKTAKQIIDYIRWNKTITKQNKAKYKIGYYDRVARSLKYFYFSQIVFDKSDDFALCVRCNTKTITIPYHRLRIVFDENQDIIWKRG